MTCTVISVFCLKLAGRLQDPPAESRCSENYVLQRQGIIVLFRFLNTFYVDSLAGFHVFQTVNDAMSLTGMAMQTSLGMAVQTSLLPATCQYYLDLEHFLC